MPGRRMLIVAENGAEEEITIATGSRDPSLRLRSGQAVSRIAKRGDLSVVVIPDTCRSLVTSSLGMTS